MTFPALVRELQDLGVSPESTIASLVSVAVGTDRAQAPLPVTGYHLVGRTHESTGGVDLVLFMVVGTDLVRFEASGPDTMTVTIPLRQVVCLTERTTPTEYALILELDAQAQVSIAEAQQDGDLLRQVTRTERAAYTLIAPVGGPVAAGAPTATQLLAFRQALRTALITAR